MTYQEKFETANNTRSEYQASIDMFIAQMQQEADKKRADYVKNIKGEQERYRKDFCSMLGFPLNAPNNEIPTVEKELLSEEKDIRIFRLQFNMPYGLKFYGLFFEQKTDKPLPLVITQHGGAGTPELCSGLLDIGSANYNGMVERTLEYGVHCFAPQLLLWNSEWCGMPPYSRELTDVKLKQVGSSITALEVFCIMKSIDCLEKLESVDENKIGMLGLSYGGFYTLYTAAADTRIKVALSCAQYNDRYKYAREDWVFDRSAHSFLDNEICMLVYPRHLFIQVGDKDDLFGSETAVKEYNRLSDMAGEHNFHLRLFEGTHEYYKGNEDLEEFIKILKN